MRATATSAPNCKGKRRLLESCAIMAGLAALAAVETARVGLVRAQAELELVREEQRTALLNAHV